MLQTTFDNYRLATADASVRLTTELLQDIENGRMFPELNGTKVSLREKTIAVKMLETYSCIFQEHTLTDIADRDVNNIVVDNRTSRRQMQDLIEGINLITGLGLNSSEDFILDRVPVDVVLPTVTLSVTQEPRNGRAVSIRVSLSTSVAVSSDTTFTIRDSNSGGEGSAVTTDITITEGSTSGFAILSFATPPLNGYTTVFTINDIEGFETAPVGGIQITVPAFSQTVTLAVQQSRVGDDVTFRLRLTTNFILDSDTTFTVNDSNSGGTGNNVATQITIASNSNTAFRDVTYTPANVVAGYTTTFTVSPVQDFTIIPEGGVEQTVAGIAANQVNIVASLTERSAARTLFTLTVNTDEAVGNNTVFAINTSNAFGNGLTSTINVTVPAGMTTGSVTTNSTSASLDTYTASFTLVTPLPAGFAVGNGFTSVTVSSVSLADINVVATVLTRTASETAIRLVFSTTNNVLINTTSSVEITNPYGLGPATTLTVNGTIPSGQNSVTVDVNSTNASTSAYQASFAFVTPLPTGFGPGTITSTLDFDALPAWELDSFNTVSAGFLDVGNDGLRAEGLWMNSAGTLAFTVTANQAINKYTLSTPYDITSGSLTQSDSIEIADLPEPSSILFSPDGLHMFIASPDLQLVDGAIAEYVLTTAFDLSTAPASPTRSIDLITSSVEPTGMDFNADGSVLYVYNSDSEGVNRYSLPTPYTLIGAVHLGFTTLAPHPDNGKGLFFGDSGNRLYISNIGDRIIQYNLSTAYDITTATFSKATVLDFGEDPSGAEPRGLSFNPNGNIMYVLQSSGAQASGGVRRIHRFNI